MLDFYSKISLAISIFSAYLAIFKNRNPLKNDHSKDISLVLNGSEVSEVNHYHSVPNSSLDDNFIWMGREKYDLFTNFGLELYEDLENAETIDKQMNHLIQKKEKNAHILLNQDYALRTNTFFYVFVYRNL